VKKPEISGLFAFFLQNHHQNQSLPNFHKIVAIMATETDHNREWTRTMIRLACRSVLTTASAGASEGGR
jgi:hypothetical protein